jgi:hypothetical protein
MLRKILYSIFILGILFSTYELILNVFDVRLFDIMNVVYPTLFITLVIAVFHYSILLSKGYKLSSKPKLVIKDSSLKNINQIISRLSWKKLRQEGKTTVYKTSGFSFYSFGEIILLNENETGEIEIVSKSRFPLTMFDFGKNLDNINNFKQLTCR